MSTQDKITSHFSVNSDNTNISLDQDISNPCESVKVSSEHSTKTSTNVIGTPRSSSLPRTLSSKKRGLPSPEGAETGITKSMRNEQSGFLDVISRIESKMDNKLEVIEQTQLQMLNTLSKLEKTQISIQTSLDGLTNKIEVVEEKASNNAKSIAELETKFSALEVEVDCMKSSIKIKETNNSVEQVNQLHSVLVNQYKTVRKETLKLKEYTQRHNLLFLGLQENKGEDCARMMNYFILHEMGLPNAFQHIDKAHRLGHYVHGKTRPIVVKFTTHHAKEVTYSMRWKLENTGYSVKLHLPEEQERQVQLLDKVVTLAKKKDPNARRVGERILYRKSMYDMNSIRHTDIPTHTIHQTESNNAIGFLGKLHPLSNFYAVNMNIDGIEYSSVEKYYQLKKAEFYGDVKAIAEISLQDDPVAIKRVAKSFVLPNGEKPVSDTEFEHFHMRKALEAKFEDPFLQRFLLSTGEKLLVECNEYDIYWSCGLSLRNSNFSDRSKWRGQGKLGSIMMDIRNELKQKLSK